MDILLDNWQAVMFALLVAARAIFSLFPTEHKAVRVFSWIDLIITALVGGDRRKKKTKK